MSSATVYSAVRAWLTDAWTTTPVAWENENFDLPQPPSPFIVAEVWGDNYQQQSIGSGSPAAERWTEEGALMLHVMVPAGTGSLTARTYGEQLMNLLRGLELPGNIRFRSMSLGLGEQGNDDGTYWRVTLGADWVRG